MASPSAAELLVRVRVTGTAQAGNLAVSLRQLSAGSITRGLNAQTRALDNLGRSAGRVGGLLGRGGGLLGSLADMSLVAGGVVRGVRMIGGAVRSALTPLMDFQKGLAQVRSKGGYSPKEMAGLAESFKQIGRTTIYSPQQAAEGGIALAASGLTAKEVQSSLPVALRFAQAGDLDTESASDILVNVSRQLGQQPKDFATLADMMVKAANMSTINVRELAHTMSYVGPLAREAKLPADQLFAMISGLGNLGIKGSKAGTGIRNLLIALSKKPRRGKTSAAILGSFGMTQQDLQAGFGGAYDNSEKYGTEGLVGIPALMRVMKMKMDEAKLSDVKRVEALAVMFGAYGMTSAAGTMRHSGDDSAIGLAAFTKALGDANGETQRTADIMGDTLPGKLARLDASWNTLKITLTEEYAPALARIIEQTEKLVRSTEEFAKPETASAWKDLTREMGKTMTLMASQGEQTEPPWVRQWRTVLPLVEATRDAAIEYFRLVNPQLGGGGFSGQRDVSDEDEAAANAHQMELAIGKEPRKLNMFERLTPEMVREREAYRQRKAKYLQQQKSRAASEAERPFLRPEPEWKPGDLSPTAPGIAPGDLSPTNPQTQGMLEVLIGFDKNMTPKLRLKDMQAPGGFDLSVGITNNL